VRVGLEAGVESVVVGLPVGPAADLLVLFVLMKAGPFVERYLTPERVAITQ
jgi:hypothetical protein